MDKIQEMRSKILELNRYRRAYYNRNQSLVSNAEYDAMFEELEKMERRPELSMQIPYTACRILPRRKAGENQAPGSATIFG